MPIPSDSCIMCRRATEGLLKPSGGNEWEPLTSGLPQSDCYVNVLRNAMAVDSLDTCGVYFGTTGGRCMLPPKAGDHWAPIVRIFRRCFRWKCRRCRDYSGSAG